MDFLRPASWEEALAAKAEHPTAVPIAGGTDVMVEINFDHRRPEYLLDLNRIGDLYEWEVGEDTVRLGASVPYTKIMENLRAELPGLALASHTVASPADPQPRRRRRQPRHGLARRRRPPRPPRGRRRGRGGVGGPRHPPHPDRRVLHGRQAQRAPARRADPRRTHPEGRRPAAVLEGRHPQRHGHRRVRLRARPAPADPDRAHRHRLGRPPPGAGQGRRGVPERGPGGGRLLGQRKDHHPVGRQAVRGPVLGRLQPDRRRPGHRELPPARGGRHGPPDADLDLGVVPAAPAAPPRELRDARQLHRQRTPAGGRRRLGGRVPAVRAARAPRPAGFQERLRAGRVRFLHGPPRRRARLLLPRRRRPGGGPRGGDRRGPRRVRQAARRGRLRDRRLRHPRSTRPSPGRPRAATRRPARAPN